MRDPKNYKAPPWLILNDYHYGMKCNFDTMTQGCCGNFGFREVRAKYKIFTAKFFSLNFESVTERFCISITIC